MFEGLDQIDWAALGQHVYGDHVQIPDAIRSLLSDNPDVREEMRGLLLGMGQDFGNVYDTTPHIIPFFFEILESPDGPGKAELLDHLAGVARNIWESGRWADDHLPVQTMRRYVKAYDSLKAGLPTLLSLLEDNSNAIRLASIDLLQYLTDDVEILVTEFIKHFPGEKEEDVQAAYLRGLKFLLSSLSWTRLELKEQCQPFLNEIIETSASQKIQIAGAQAMVEVFKEQVTKDLSPKVASILSDHFWKTSQAIDYRGWSEEFDNALLLIKDLVKLEAADHLIEMLQNPEITSVQAHLIARGLLALFITFSDNAYWNCRRNNDVKGRELDYVHSAPSAYGLNLYVERRAHFEWFVRLLEAIVENQKFWEIPTNMLSFFIGLPDSREQLRAILSPGGSK